MNNDILKLVRPHILELEAYLPPIPTANEGRNILKLDQNECAYGFDPAITQALADFQAYHIYEDASQRVLREKIARYAGVSKEQVIASNGSNHLIDLIARVFLNPDDQVIDCPPTFELFKNVTQLCQGRLVAVPRDEDFAVDIDKVLAAVSPQTKIIFLATPNNPTGNQTPRKDILRLLDSGVVVVVDEAYYEFSGQTMVNYLDRYPNMIIMRTFSKWAGLAGLRAGYALASASLINIFMTIRLPYVMSVAAQVAVCAVLDNPKCSQEYLARTIAERQRVYPLLKEVELFDRVMPSDTNFFLCRVVKGQAGVLSQNLRRHGIIVRHFAKDHFTKDYLRISLGTPDQNDRVITTLKQIAEE